MEFNVRAILLVQSIPADDRIDIAELLGKRVEFRGARPYSLTLPSTFEDFAALSEPERTLTAMKEWARIYRYPEGDDEIVHVVASSEDANGDPIFYRIDLRQAPPPSRRAPRPPVEFTGSAVLTHDQFTAWLIDFADLWGQQEQDRRHATVRPSARPRNLKLAWIGPEITRGVHMPTRLNAIGKVFGADISHVAPTSFRDVQAELASLTDVQSIVICTSYAPYVSADVAPESIGEEFVHLCDSREPVELEEQVSAWIEVCREMIEAQAPTQEDEDQILLVIMLRGMLSHAKIGSVNHCSKEDVLKSVRGRHLNVAAAERVLLENAEEYQASHESRALFLWKEHNEGKEYFLNTKCVDRCKSIASGNGA